MSVTITSAGTLTDGRPVEAVTLQRGAMCARILSYGAIVQSLVVPDKNGSPVDVVLGYDTPADYQADANSAMGALVGRHANRIHHAAVTIDGVRYPLVANEGENQLHGGPQGFAKQLFRVEKAGEYAAAFTYVSADGEQGFPGEVTLRAVYSLTEDGGLALHYHATTTKPTIVALTNHSYFNLSGPEALTVYDHLLQIEAKHFLPIGPGSIPTGEQQPVAGTPFDFTTEKPIGQDIAAAHPQLVAGDGYDHNFCLEGTGLRRVATLYSPDTGIVMDTLTSLPGLQLYTSNFLHPPVPGKGGKTYAPRMAVCLEAHFWPDSNAHPDFPDTILRPGQSYDRETIYQFGVR